jgi:multiple antibiotic resistance protein
LTIWTGALMLYLILDPVGNTPALLTLLKDTPLARRNWVIVRENLIALAVLLFFLFFGRPLLDFLGIKGPELEIAGGVVIFLISLRMMFPTRGGIMGEDEFAGEPFVVPLAVPLIAGPSAIAVVMLFTSARPDAIALPAAVVAVLCAWSASLATLLVGHQLARALGRRGVVATERLMGMVLCVIAVHIMLVGVEAYFGWRAAVTPADM